LKQRGGGGGGGRGRQGGREERNRLIIMLLYTFPKTEGKKGEKNVPSHNTLAQETPRNQAMMKRA
jgi:hypothetical protein